MFTVTDNARRELDAFFANREKTPIRLYMAPGGCSGPRLSLALDEICDDDVSQEAFGYTFCIGKDLWDAIEGASIDVTAMGFLVLPEKPLPYTGGCGCSSCGTGTCGGCH